MLVLRADKGSELSYEELDGNFKYLDANIDALKDVPSNEQTAIYTLALTDRGKSIDTTANVTIPLNSAVAFPIGSVVSITNLSVASINILVTSGVTLHIAGTADTGDCTLALYGMATMRKVATDTWFITGSGVS